MDTQKPVGSHNAKSGKMSNKVAPKSVSAPAMAPKPVTTPPAVQPAPKPAAKPIVRAPKPAPKPAAKPVVRAPKPAGKSSSNKPAKASVSKAAFVRNQPVGMPAKLVIAAAAKLGMTMSPDYIHKVRSTAKAKAAARPAQANAPASKPAAPRKAPAPKKQSVKPIPVARHAGLARAGAPESSFRRLVLELGLPRARKLIADVEQQLSALIAGR